MSLFRGAGRKAGRVAKNIAKNMIMPQDDAADSKKKASKAEAAAAPQHTDEEYEALKEKYEAVMRSKWEEYYKSSCDGECETCEYYDWCPDDFVDEDLVDEGAQDKEAPFADDDTQDAEHLGQESEEDSAKDLEEELPEDEVELTEEDLAAKEAAETYYEAGCDGECESCEHYDWCPAELEEDPDDKVLFKGLTQGDVKNVAKEGVNLAREGALAAKELKEAMDDIFGGFDFKNLTK